MLSVVRLGDEVPCVQGVTTALQQVYAAYTAMQANKEAGAALAHRAARLVATCEAIKEHVGAGAAAANVVQFLADVKATLDRVHGLLAKFGKRKGWIKQLWKAQSTKAAFEALGAELTTGVQDLHFAVAKEQLQLQKATFAVLERVAAKVDALGGEGAVAGDVAKAAEVARAAGVSDADFEHAMTALGHQLADVQDALSQHLHGIDLKVDGLVDQLSRLAAAFKDKNYDAVERLTIQEPPPSQTLPEGWRAVPSSSRPGQMAYGE
jgi:uncharacterized coiled-coil protein SlyX